MLWKILGAVLAVWLVFVVLGVIVKGVFWLVTLVVLGVGVYVIYKALASNDSAEHR